MDGLILFVNTKMKYCYMKLENIIQSEKQHYFDSTLSRSI
jgi:hypothetical protein